MESKMKFIKSIIPLLVVSLLGVFQSADAQDVGQETNFDRQLNTRDDQPVREFVQSKENIDIKEKSRNLEISGDVRFEWRSIQEKGIVLYKNCESGSNGSYCPSDFHERFRSLRGGDHVDMRGLPISTNDFDVEFNFKVKYSFKKAWAAAHLQFDNPAGIRGRNDCEGVYSVFNCDGSEVEDFVPRDTRRALKGSGEAMFITLKRAYMGYNVFADGKQRVDIELGRRKLDDVFDSEIQFTNRFDGALFKYAVSVKNITDFYWNTAVFVVDERVNHFGYVSEVGFLDIYESGFDIKYSFINWQKNGKNRCFIRNPLGANFLNSQITLAYTFSPMINGRDDIPVEFYGGFLVNHAAKKTIFTKGKKKNLGWYAGVYIGNVDKEGDWSIDIEYIGVQAQAVPENDVGSIGRGNIYDEHLLDIIDGYCWNKGSNGDSSLYSCPSSYIIGYLPRRGNTNFVGWRFECLYAITDNLSLDFVYEFSNEEDKRIGGPHRYSDFEIEAIYAF
jgi:hypothetical protein